MKSRLQLIFVLILTVSLIYGGIIRIPDDQPTIQAGIDLASPGDTVLVSPGTYSGDGNFHLDFNGKAILIMSETGAENCIIDATGGYGFYFHSEEQNASIIRGFTIINGWDGVYCEGASPVIEYCVIENCDYGIYSSINWSNMLGSAPVIKYNLIKNNKYDGIQAYEAGNPVIMNNTIVNNIEYGIRTGFVDADIINNIIVGNAYGISKDIPDEGSIYLAYNDVWNNDSTNYYQISAGENDISLDPLFIGEEDYHLQSGSPCIDAGSPTSELDSDGTPADIGANYYHQTAVTLQADFNSDVVTGQVPLTVQFTDQSAGSPTSWSWDFGDGGESTEQNPSHTYNNAGTYTVTLTVSDGTNSDTMTKENLITVTDAPTVDESFQRLATVPDEEGTAYYSGAFISDNVAYIVTSHNRLFKTSNGGDTWVDISPEQGTDFDLPGVTPRVSFIDENIGAVAFSVDDGANSYNYDVVFAYVWCTTDGGQTWSQRFDVNEDQIKHLQQVTENTVYVGGTAKLGVSSNKWFKKIVRDSQTGDYSIVNIISLPSSRPHVMAANWLNENTGVAIGKLNVPPYTSEPFITHDGGTSWSSINGNLPVLDNIATSISDNAVQFIDENSIIFAYYRLEADSTYKSYIWKTTDLGVSWTLTDFDIPATTVNSIYIDKNSLNGIAVGGDSLKACYITNDGGSSWTQSVLPAMPKDLFLYQAQITPDGKTWIIGNQLSIWKSKAELSISSDPFKEGSLIPTVCSLNQNYPNPFNPTTTISYDIPQATNVSIVIYDINGRLVEKLVSEYVQPGRYAAVWNATNHPSGMYIMRMTAGSFRSVKKMMLMN